MQERLQKILARHGIASRRKAEELILSGAIKVNGRIAKLGDKADETKDYITYKKQRLGATDKRENNFVYYLLNKPVGYICSLKRKDDEKLATDLVPKKPRVWTVGRLDKDSCGLLMLTNDGQLTEQLTHPKFEHEKEYLVKVNKNITERFLDKLLAGIELAEGLATADNVKQIKKDEFIITLHQGWKRQIRRMCTALNYEVKELKRIRIGQWTLKNLKEGEYITISNI
ncbi:MAG TPA: pseudouridine synthase [bacterium]|nr:pseudouridine synthase [bacterium]